jgi:hypothetical protein
MSDRDPLSLLQLESEASSRIPMGSVLGVIFLDSLISPTFLRSRTDEDPTPNFTMLKMIVKSIANELGTGISKTLSGSHCLQLYCSIMNKNHGPPKNVKTNRLTGW